MVGPPNQDTQIFSFCTSDEHNNEFGKGWWMGSELMTGPNISNLPILKTDPLYQLFIKDNIF